MSSLHLRALPQGPWSQAKRCFTHYSSHIGLHRLVQCPHSPQVTHPNVNTDADDVAATTSAAPLLEVVRLCCGFAKVYAWCGATIAGCLANTLTARCSENHVYLEATKELGRSFGKYTMDFLSVPEYVIKKGRPHGHRYGKKPGDKEYFTANQLKKKCQKRDFQGIQ